MSPAFPVRPCSLLLLLCSFFTSPFSALGGEPDFAALARKHEAATVADRRYLHAHPELALREFETQRYLRETLARIPGIELVEGAWGTGLVALLRGGHPGPLVAWRADFDALPITETTGLPFASTRQDTVDGGRPTGVMHACGHDLHMTVGLGALRILSEVRAELPGSVLFIGQPAEETGEGAARMLAAGVFENGRRPNALLAIHVHPTVPFGQVSSCSGPCSANVDAFLLRVRGRGGHGAYPHKAIDPVTLAAQIVLALQSTVMREMDVGRHSVISVGSIHGGTTENVIPEEVVIQATVRSPDEETRLALKEKIERLVRGLAEAAGAPEPELQYTFGTPAGNNDPRLAEQCREVFRRVLGPDNEIRYEPVMGGEDFAYYGKEVPGFQFRLGVGRPEREMALHRGDFDPDERAVGLGMRLAAELLWDQLHRPR